MYDQDAFIVQKGQNIYTVAQKSALTPILILSFD